MQTVSFTTKPK